MKTSLMRSVSIGVGCWIIIGCFLHSSSFDLKWGVWLFLLAPLVLIPLGLKMVEFDQRDGIEVRLRRYASSIQLPAAIILSIAFTLPVGLLAGALSLPWLMTAALISVSGLVRVWRRGLGPSEELSIDAGLIYLVVGGVWALFSRLGVRPLDFDPVIVFLTAIHFHFAGFVLPLMVGLAARQLKTRLARIAALGVVTGVPFTAIGITMSQVGLSHAPELLAALITSIAGLMTAGLLFVLARRQPHPRITRWCWFIAAVALSFSMLLAALYGSRFYLPISWLDIPWMRALHGSANALGFGFTGLTGWYLKLWPNSIVRQAGSGDIGRKNMKSVVDVRMARPTDEDGVLRLAKAFATSFEVTEGAFREGYRAALGHQGTKLLVAEREGSVVGYLLGFIHPTFYANGPVAWVEELMIEAAARREGIGSHLLARFEQWACEHGAHLVALATRRASAFYEAAGYSKSAIYFRKLL